MKNAKKILIVVKNEEQGKRVQRELNSEGYKVDLVNHSYEAFTKLDVKNYDLIIADYYLTDIRGSRFYKEVAEVYPDMPIIFMSNRANVDTISSVLERPNTDYLVHPFVIESLLARIKAFTAEEDSNDRKVLQSKDLELDTKTFKAKRREKTIDLSPKEYKLLKYLIDNQGIVLTRNMILRKVWGYTHDVSSRIVDVYIGYLREKIDNSHKEKLIETVPGFGYKLKKKEASSEE